MRSLPSSKRLNGRFVAKVFWGKVFVVPPHLAFQRPFLVVGAVEVVRPEHPLLASIERLQHAVDLRRSGLGQPVLDTRCLPQRVKLMLIRGVLGALVTQPDGELPAAVVSSVWILTGTA